ncbi:BatA domain-containing protein [Hymenobacter sp. AT01-02]|uniref:BatA domain-containing protein n=1 Tax=Hymenobacter sp. AT01-02 TaxID=1571877 RepID=UPI0005F18B8A|nr:BatA domain-containing protein [Hymenobacter sp. AT01-02]
MPAFFLQHATAGVLALLGLAVPVAIYLWNRRPGRVVQVGSLRWLETGANRRLRSLKPEGLLLLLVRAAIVGLLALALAYPSWQAAAPAPRGQVLLSLMLPRRHLARFSLPSTPFAAVGTSCGNCGPGFRYFRPKPGLRACAPPPPTQYWLPMMESRTCGRRYAKRPTPSPTAPW